MDCLKLDLSDLAEEKKNLLKDTQVLYHQLAKAQEKVSEFLLKIDPAFSY